MADDIKEEIGYTYAEQKQVISAEAFTDAMDGIITALGGTPAPVELHTITKRSDASFKHLVTDELFQVKMNEVIEALGGTPEPVEFSESNNYAAQNHLVQVSQFTAKMAEVADNASGGGGGSEPNYQKITVEVVNSYGDAPTEIGTFTGAAKYVKCYEVPSAGGSVQIPCVQAISNYYISGSAKTVYVGFFVFNNVRPEESVTISGAGNVIQLSPAFRMPIKNGSTDLGRTQTTKGVFFRFVNTPAPTITITYGSDNA